MFKPCFLSCLYTYAILNITIEAFTIDEFNTLVQYPMWKSLLGCTYNVQLRFSDYNSSDNNKEFSLQTLFSNESYPNIITEENFIERVWQFHLLLSVYYALELLPMSKLILEVWYYCQNKVSLKQDPSYYKIFFYPIIILNLEIKRMQKSLSYFSDVLNSVFKGEISYINEIYQALGIIEDLTSKGTLPDVYVKNKLDAAYQHVKQFFVNHVQPISSVITHGNELIISEFVVDVFKTQNRQQDITKPIEKQFKTYIWHLIQSNNNSGLQFDPNNVSVSVGIPSEIILNDLFSKLSL